MISFVFLGNDFFEEMALKKSVFFLNQSYSWWFGKVNAPPGDTERGILCPFLL